MDHWTTPTGGYTYLMTFHKAGLMAQSFGEMAVERPIYEDVYHTWNCIIYE
jgi:hypothetical protein